LKHVAAASVGTITNSDPDLQDHVLELCAIRYVATNGDVREDKIEWKTMLRPNAAETGMTRKEEEH